MPNVITILIREGGLKAEHLIQRQFEASQPLEKCYTVVTEFAIPASEQKLYLSPVLDGYNSEIIAYNLSTSPNLQQISTMLEKAFPNGQYQGTIFRSDQGWRTNTLFIIIFSKTMVSNPPCHAKAIVPTMA